MLLKNRTGKTHYQAFQHLFKPAKLGVLLLIFQKMHPFIYNLSSINYIFLTIEIKNTGHPWCIVPNSEFMCMDFKTISYTP